VDAQLLAVDVDCARDLKQIICLRPVKMSPPLKVVLKRNVRKDCGRGFTGLKGKRREVVDKARAGRTHAMTPGTVRGGGVRSRGLQNFRRATADR
jgi:hypothetical protein